MANMTFSNVLDHAREIAPDLIELRRTIHRYPETSFEEHHTSVLVAGTLRSLGLDVEEGFGGSTAVVAMLRGAAPGLTVLLRADMDALTIQEASGVPFASERPGFMHACGHDAHTSALLGAARILSGRRNEIRGNIKFVFQPGEEDFRGGRFLLEKKVLEDPPVNGAFALHVDPFLPAGTISVRAGPVFAAGTGFVLEILGKGGHPGLPHQTVDAIVVAAQVVQAVQILTSRQANPQEPFTLGFGTIHGGTRANVISGQVSLSGTIRALDSRVLDEATTRFEKIVHSTVEAFGATCRLDIRAWGPPLINHPAMVAHVRNALIPLLGADRVIPGKPILAGEDFSLFAERIPSAMVMLGAGFSDRENKPLHHPQFEIDEAALPVGAAVLAASALDFLNTTKT